MESPYTVENQEQKRGIKPMQEVAGFERNTGG